MTKQQVCTECGGPVKVYYNQTRNPHSKCRYKKSWKGGITLKDHDLCNRCWKKFLKEGR